MPNIDWTLDFRLAVIARIANSLTLAAWKSGHVVSVMHDKAEAIVYIAHSPAKFLDKNRSTIEAALGCTLKEMQEDMERRVAP